jgi:predicted esterase
MDAHSWLLATPGLAASFEWPELTGINTDCRHLVQFGREDPLFTRQGMRDADARLIALAAGSPGRYTGTWYDAGHVVTAGMFQEFTRFLASSLSP